MGGDGARFVGGVIWPDGWYATWPFGEAVIARETLILRLRGKRLRAVSGRLGRFPIVELNRENPVIEPFDGWRWLPGVLSHGLRLFEQGDKAPTLFFCARREELIEALT